MDKGEANDYVSKSLKLKDDTDLLICRRLEVDGRLIIQGKKGLDFFYKWVLDIWQAGDDLFINKAEFIREKK